jgi:hypothetical protein
MSTSLGYQDQFGRAPDRICAPMLDGLRQPATLAAATPEDSASATVRCASCGFAPPLTPADAVAVIVSLPGRYRALLDAAGPLETIDGLLRSRRRPGEWSTLGPRCVSSAHNWSRRLLDWRTWSTKPHRRPGPSRTDAATSRSARSSSSKRRSADAHRHLHDIDHALASAVRSIAS